MPEAVRCPASAAPRGSLGGLEVRVWTAGPRGAEKTTSGDIVRG